ncbi:c-type cytochrome [Granulicella mallensis]|uniref:Cytochrome c class I n=1 Tax=Granulicella mallensis (strain ATCC BAA-1857 / DSM 23137 / MP5ACTX8) TaxID=682795 RepID=G8NPP5_GRAMM|nr:c-type cytochrome [Granulicella mallensis]AEU36057.1 cytochrome c class I [Granulicella mallensis MP5ACTX8]
MRRLLSIALSGTALLGAVSLVGGCKVGTPSKLEKNIVVATKHHVTVGNKSEKNPIPYTADNLATGKEAFGHYCVACHGMDGQNTGVPFADRMSPPLPPLTAPEVQSYTDGQLKWVIDNGLSPSGMPASKGTLSDDEIWSIVLFLRHLPPAGSAGEPEMYSH